MLYEVSGIHPSHDGNEVCGGDRETLKEFKSKTPAFNYAKKQSAKKEWYETTIYAFDKQGEIAGHWYFANGKEKISMI